MIKKPSVSHFICHLIATNGPATKAELLQQLAQIKGMEYDDPKKWSSAFRDYFDPCTNVGWTHGSAKVSMLVRGDIKVVGKQGRSNVFGLEVKGFQKAVECKEWLDSITSGMKVEARENYEWCPTLAKIVAVDGNWVTVKWLEPVLSFGLETNHIVAGKGSTSRVAIFNISQ